MIANWPFSPALMFLSFPLLCAALLLLIHVTVQLMPRTIRQHHVSYRPIRTHLADLRLIVRLLWSSRKRNASEMTMKTEDFFAAAPNGKGAAAFSGLL